MNKFLIGLVFGIAIAGGLAVYLNNEPTQFIKKNVGTSGALVSSAPLILEPGTKIREASSGRMKSRVASAPMNYDFYDVLQERKVASGGAPAANSMGHSNNSSAGKVKDDTKFLIQAGAFTDAELASDMRGRLALLGIDSRVKTQQIGGTSVNRVIIGPISNEAKAQTIINQLSDQQINAALIRITK
ncbi:MAG: SPOR domain-containing protein [Burkholderiales bacterium]|nr:SPOR domain-containing protein [Burkholderiales bacterium]